LTYPLHKKKLNLKRVESIIRDIIPMGEGRGSTHSVPAASESFIARYIAQAQPSLDRLCAKYNVPTVNLDYEYFVHLCDKIGANVGATLRSFGTLGSGNHFIEVNIDPSTKEHYLTVHSGSRGFGMKLFEYHNAKVDRSVRCLSGPEAIEYFMDLICAQYLAKMNRHIMLMLILREIAVPLTEDELIESTHNYIDFGGDEMILRKGAISAREDEPCIIALNMRDGICVGRGLGNSEWNYSCAHGCGRAMTRTEARRRIKLKDFKAVMRDVVSTCVCEGTLDEAPQAYKDMDVVLEAIQPTMVLETRLVSVINLKGLT
jgi:tRNA-splicing ligase RtcB